MEPKNARRDPRLPLTLEVRVKPLAAPAAGEAERAGDDADPASVRHGRTRNVAAGGAFVVFDDGDALPVGAPILLEIDAPSLHTPLEVRGEVRWVRPSADDPGGFGVRFIEADRRASAALAALLEAKTLVDGASEPPPSRAPTTGGGDDPQGGPT